MRLSYAVVNLPELLILDDILFDRAAAPHCKRGAIAAKFIVICSRARDF